MLSRTGWALLAIAAVGWALRAFPLIDVGAFGYPVDYDEGVYFGSAALLARGQVPYRDFVMVHPPGLLYFLLPAAWSSEPATGLAAARWLATLVGAVNILLIGRVALRWAGPTAAIVAAAFYAAHPEAVLAERGPFLEPSLNLCCIAFALVWLKNASNHPSGRGMLICGALCGVACSIKITGGVWLIAALLATPPIKLRQLLAFAIAAVVTWLACCAPVAAFDSESFFREVFWFHLHRPRDGASSVLSRLRGMFAARGLILDTALIAVGLTFAALRARYRVRTVERFFLSAFVLTVATFLTARSFWDQYNAHLAVAESALAGYAGAILWKWARDSRSRLVWVPIAIFLLAVPCWGVRRALLSGSARSPELLAVARFVRTQVPANAPVFSFEPAWAIAGGRLPDARAGKSLVTDWYATMLLDALRSGDAFTDVSEALKVPSSQATLRAALNATRYALVPAGFPQLTAQTRQWFQSNFVRRFPLAGSSKLEAWERAQ